MVTGRGPTPGARKGPLGGGAVIICFGFMFFVQLKRGRFLEFLYLLRDLQVKGLYLCQLFLSSALRKLIRKLRFPSI